MVAASHEVPTVDGHELPETVLTGNELPDKVYPVGTVFFRTLDNTLWRSDGKRWMRWGK